jgi:hypothetical protein
MSIKQGVNMFCEELELFIENNTYNVTDVIKITIPVRFEEHDNDSSDEDEDGYNYFDKEMHNTDKMIEKITSDIFDKYNLTRYGPTETCNNEFVIFSFTFTISKYTTGIFHAWCEGCDEPHMGTYCWDCSVCGEEYEVEVGRVDDESFMCHPCGKDIGQVRVCHVCMFSRQVLAVVVLKRAMRRRQV